MSKVIYNRGDIWMVDLGIGEKEGSSLQYGRRPCVIVSNPKGNFFSPVLSIIPLTTKKIAKEYPTHVFIPKSEANRMLYDSTALCEQGLTVDKKQVMFRIGTLEKEYIDQLNQALLITLGLLEV